MRDKLETVMSEVAEARRPECATAPHPQGWHLFTSSALDIYKYGGFDDPRASHLTHFICTALGHLREVSDLC